MANIWACIRFLIGPISITYMLQPILGLENCFKFYGRNMSLYKISNWHNIYYLHVAANFRAGKLLQNLWQIFESVSRFLIVPISITYMLQPTLGLENCFKIYGKNMSLYNISNWPNIYYLHVAANFMAGKLLQNLWQIYESVSIFLTVPIYYLHVAAIFRARKLLQNLWQKYEPV